MATSKPGKISANRRSKAKEKQLKKSNMKKNIEISDVDKSSASDNESLDPPTIKQETKESIDRDCRLMEQEYDSLLKERSALHKKFPPAPVPLTVNGKKKRGAKPKDNYFANILESIKKDWSKYEAMD